MSSPMIVLVNIWDI